MSFEKDLRKAVESIDIPEELLPVNIEAMLRNADRSAQKNTSADIDRSEKITAKKTNRTIIKACCYRKRDLVRGCSGTVL